MVTLEELCWMFHLHRGEMCLASGANLSRSEGRSYPSCLLFSTVVLTIVVPASEEFCHRRPHEIVYHGPAEGTWTNVCGLSFLRRGRSVSPEAARFPIRMGARCRHHQQKGPMVLIPWVHVRLAWCGAPGGQIGQRSFPEWERAE